MISSRFNTRDINQQLSQKRIRLAKAAYDQPPRAGAITQTTAPPLCSPALTMQYRRQTKGRRLQAAAVVHSYVGTASGSFTRRSAVGYYCIICWERVHYWHSAHSCCFGALRFYSHGRCIPNRPALLLNRSMLTRVNMKIITVYVSSNSYTSIPFVTLIGKRNSLINLPL